MSKKPNCPTCFDCKNAKCSAGFPDTREQPGEPPEAECQLSEELVSFDDAELFYDDSTNCKHFVPVLVGPCSCCKTDIKAPLFSWPLFSVVFHGDYVPVCSSKCQDKMKEIFIADQKAQDLYYKEMESYTTDFGYAFNNF